MIIVSDTTPVHYLILIQREFILPELFGEILIPEAVAREMLHENTPDLVRGWIHDPPDWVTIRAALPKFEHEIAGLGQGETAAIALAIEERADAILMDDRKAIREARKNNLTVLTTFAVLELAAVKNLIDLPMVLNELAQTSFRLPPEEIIEDYLNRDRERSRLSNLQ